MKKVTYENLGKELAKLVKEEFARTGVSIPVLSTKTDDWHEELWEAEETGHFEFTYKNRTCLFFLKVRTVFDEADNVLDVEYYI